MADEPKDPPDFEALARQYWSAWGETMRNASIQAARKPGLADAQARHDAIDWWTRVAHGEWSQANQAVERFSTQAQQWFGKMQQVAAQFAGQDAGAAEITRAWKQALGAAGQNPFPEMLRGMRGQGLQGLDQWIDDASPFLEAFRVQSASALRLQQFGFAREHQERAQRLVRAQMEVQQHTSAYNALMLKASQSAYEIFESKLVEHEEPGRQIDSPRALFDLWIDAAEEAYARIALSPEFREVYGNLVNSQMRLRGAVQREVEQVSAMFGMPTRSELDGVHRKIVELERTLRRMRDAMPATPGSGRQAKIEPQARRKPAAGARSRASGAKSSTGSDGKPVPAKKKPVPAKKKPVPAKKKPARKPVATGKGRR